MADRLNRASNTLLYLYGITEKPATMPPELRGVDGIAAVEPIELAGVTGWISRVPAAEFGDNLARNMENLEWLADASVRHQRVVGAIHERQPILPARFGVVFVTQESLAADVVARKPALKASFARIAGADEWGIRIFAQPRPAPGTSQARSGKEYLQRKSTLLQARPSRALDPEIIEFAAALANLATASAEPGKVAAGQAGLRWQTSVLLPRSRRAKLQGLLSRFARDFGQQFRVECTGPWPPYSFVANGSEPQRPKAKRAPAQRVAR